MKHYIESSFVFFLTFLLGVSLLGEISFAMEETDALVSEEVIYEDSEYDTDDSEYGQGGSVVTGEKSSYIRPGEESASIFCKHQWKVIKTKRSTALEKGWRLYRCTKCGTQKKTAIAKLKPYIRLSRTKMTMQEGDRSSALKVSSMQKGDKLKAFTSSNTQVVTVNRRNGVLKARKKGKAVITVRLASGKTAECKVIVQ